MTKSTRRHLLAVLGCSTAPLVGGMIANQQDIHAGEPGEARNDATGSPETSVQLDVTSTDVHPEGGEQSQKWVYNDSYPGPVLKIQEGRTFKATVTNHISPRTTVHWHGIPVPNRMDGVPNVTQQPIQQGESFTYEYQAAPAGTYLYHSHVGLQSDWGLKGPLIIEEANPHVEYDREYTVVLNEYLVPKPPSDKQFPSIPSYDALIMNGRLPDAPPTFEVQEGERVRFRLINAGSATTFQVSFGGHPMTVAYADGRPVEPVEVTSAAVGVAERFDVIVSANNPGTWALKASPLNGDDIGNPPPARGILDYQETSSTDATEPTTDGPRLEYGDLVAKEPYEGISGSPDRTYDLTLSRGPKDGSWTINDQIYPDTDPLDVRPEEHIRFRMDNTSEMFHPMHLHGHFFQVQDAILDTVLVAPDETVTLDFYTDNPGDWLFHCHNDYHRVSGMARVVRYE